MKIIPLGIFFTLVVFGTSILLSNVHAGDRVLNNQKKVSVLKRNGKSVAAFPDVCKTPSPGGPVPVPYPNVVFSKDSDFSKGIKRTKRGGSIQLKGKPIKTSKGDEPGYEVTVTNKAGRKVSLNRSKVFELADGTYCAICVKQGRVTRILKLSPVKKKK